MKIQKTYKQRWLILATVMTGTIMAPIDTSIINIAMPTLSKVFNAPLEVISWISMAYLLITSSTLLTFGRLGDILGYRRLYLSGLLLFTIASIICGLSSHINILIAGRVLQAVGAAMLMSMSPAILTAIFPPEERGKALGINAMAVAVGLAIGPGLGGLLLATTGWTFIFFINIPIGVIAYLWGYRMIPDSEKVQNEKFDIPGAVVAFCLLFSLLLFINHGGQWGWTSFKAIAAFGIIIICFTLFIYIEKRHPTPMLDLSLFKIKLFTAGNISTLLNFCAQFIMVFLTPFYLTQRGFFSSTAGIILTTYPVVMLIISPISGALSDRFGSRELSTLGAMISAIGIFLMSFLTLESSILQIVFNLFIFGIGNALFQSPNNSSVMGSVPRARLGITSSFLATMRNVGMVLGIAIGGAVFTNFRRYFLTLPNTSGTPLENISFMYAIRIAYLTGMMIDILCAITSATRGKESSILNPGHKARGIL
jgi:EmrB/QacA subfamily drug resistance transporter